MVRATGLFHATLVCWDIDRAERFYREVLGIGRHATPSYFPGDVVFLDLGNAMVHLTRRAVALLGVGGEAEFIARQEQCHALGVHIAIEVDDLDAALERVKAAGRPILHGPLTRPDGMRCFYFVDTEHNRVELVQH
jgi:catechol 2,3-dioxygenase-like lactoylglutathione lyase family enzyme